MSSRTTIGVVHFDSAQNHMFKFSCFGWFFFFSFRFDCVFHISHIGMERHTVATATPAPALWLWQAVYESRWINKAHSLTHTHWTIREQQKNIEVDRFIQFKRLQQKYKFKSETNQNENEEKYLYYMNIFMYIKQSVLWSSLPPLKPAQLSQCIRWFSIKIISPRKIWEHTCRVVFHRLKNSSKQICIQYLYMSLHFARYWECLMPKTQLRITEIHFFIDL